jgi:hypothetical protein
VTATLDAIRRWGEDRDWQGYDPYDGLNAPLGRALARRNRLAARVFTQVVKRSPLNLRPLLGIAPERNAKAIGLVASAYARLAAAGHDDARAALPRWLDWLREHPSPGAELAWGYHFPVRTAVLAYEAHEPNTIATSFVAGAFLDAAEYCGDEQAAETAAAAARFLRAELLAGDTDEPFFRYIRGDDVLVHNANLLAASVLARVARVVDAPDLAQLAAAAARTSLAAQRADGAWPYAAGAQHTWVDNFHTGYVLESAVECLPVVPEARAQIQAGAEFWRRELFLQDGTPRYSTAATYPLDGHCYAEAIETWVALARIDPTALERADEAAAVLARDMLAADGHVLFQRGRLWTNRTAFVRWTTAPAFRALAGLELARRRTDLHRLREGEHAHLG